MPGTVPGMNSPNVLRPATASAPADERLSPHFWLSEFTASQMAVRRGLDNSPTFDDVQRLRRLAATLEQVRKLLGNAPIVITSGFRSAAVNRAVGGSLTSLHMQGCAADFSAPAFGSAYEICKLIATQASMGALEFQELILEGGWVHLAIAPDLASRGLAKVSTAVFRRGGLAPVYVPGIQQV